MKKFLLILFMTSLISCMPTKPLTPTEKLVGYWYGESEKNDRRQEWFLHRSDYGTFSIHFKFYSGKFLVKWYKEYGTWKYENGFYSTETTKLEDEKGFFYPDSPDQIYHAKYQTIELTENLFQYKDVKGNEVYQVKRVSADYEF